MIGLGESRRSVKDVGNVKIIGCGHFNGCSIAWKRRLRMKKIIKTNKKSCINSKLMFLFCWNYPYMYCESIVFDSETKIVECSRSNSA